MSNSKHTPGPWGIEIENGLTHVTAGTQLACIYNPGYARDEFLLDEAKANARLIAAAPSMFDLLLRAKDAIEALDGTSVENEKLVDDYRALLNRIEG